MTSFLPRTGNAATTRRSAILHRVKSFFVKSLDEYLGQVANLRAQWQLPQEKELWFRAEDARYESSRLRPRLYRPIEGKASRSVEELLAIENRLYKEFERCATQLCDVRAGEDWEWEWYFLMQHHGVPTRLLDWTDGALIGLHFALRYKSAKRPYEPLV